MGATKSVRLESFAKTYLLKGSNFPHIIYLLNYLTDTLPHNLYSTRSKKIVVQSTFGDSVEFQR